MIIQMIRNGNMPFHVCKRLLLFILVEGRGVAKGGA